MGTRALIHIKESGLNSLTLVTIYRQYDGYYQGLGKDIYEILGNCQIINGYGGQSLPEHFNGMGCLAAYLVGELKKKTIGNVYLYPPNSKNVGEEYVYTIYLNDSDKKIYVNVMNETTLDIKLNSDRYREIIQVN